MVMRDKIFVGSKWIEMGWDEVNFMFYISFFFIYSELDLVIVEKRGMDDFWSI